MSERRIIPLVLDSDLLKLIERVRKDRRDGSRSNVIRQLILRSLGELSYLDEQTKKSLGMLEALHA